MKKILNAIKTLLIVAVVLGLGYGLFLVTSSIDNDMTTMKKAGTGKLKTAKALKVPEVNITMPGPVQFLLPEDEPAREPMPVDDSPEIEAHDYKWLDGLEDNCHKEFKADVSEALANNDKITKSEYSVIIKRCTAHIDNKKLIAKEKLKAEMKEKFK